MIFTFLLVTSQSPFYTIDIVVAVVADSVYTNTQVNVFFVFLFYFVVKAALNGTSTWRETVT